MWFISLCIQWCLWMNECLSGGKVALIYYGSVALTFTVRQSAYDSIPNLLTLFCSITFSFLHFHLEKWFWQFLQITVKAIWIWPFLWPLDIFLWQCCHLLQRLVYFMSLNCNYDSSVFLFYPLFECVHPQKHQKFQTEQEISLISDFLLCM